MADGSGRRSDYARAQVSTPGGGGGEGEDGQDDAGDGPLAAAFGEPVAVQADAEHEVDPVPGHDHREEAEDRRHNQAECIDPAGEPPVERDQVDEQSDEGPDLLGVPAPEPAPRVVGPDASQDRAGGDQEDADL